MSNNKAIPITTPLHLDTLFTSTNYLIVDFHADWCPPCRAISPLVDQLALTSTIAGELAFAKVNVDQLQQVAAQHGVSAMPTFVVFKEGKVVERVRGANGGRLKGVVARIQSEIMEKGEKEEVGKEEARVQVSSEA